MQKEKRPKSAEAERFIFAISLLIERNYARSFKEVAEKSGFKSQDFTDIKSGKKDLKRIFLDSVCEGYPINNKYVLTGEGEMLLSDKSESNQKTIKYYDVDASASPIEMFDPGNGTRYKDVVIPGFGDCDIALNVWGDSMEPILNSGEIILCKEWTENFIEFGKIYLVITKNNNRMIKYIQPSENESKVMCESANNFYKPFAVNKADILKLFLIKGHVERNSI